MAATHGVDLTAVKSAKYYRNQNRVNNREDDRPQEVVPGLPASLSSLAKPIESRETRRTGGERGKSGSRRNAAEPANTPVAPLDDALTSMSQTFSAFF
jgi:hypothetical protein